MYGYDVPRYIREYLSEWRRYDRQLRVRRSLDLPGMYILERRTVYRVDYPAQRGTDRAVQLKDSYRMVFRFWPNEARYVTYSLALADSHREGAKDMARRLDTADAKEIELLDRRYISDCEAVASDLFDRLAWEEKRRVSFASA
jgi:hypothetical protein